MKRPALPVQHVCVIGCGRSLRQDDQAGLRVVSALQKSWLRSARLVLTESPAADLPNCLDGTGLLVLVDAARSDQHHPPGTWRRFDYHGPAATLRHSRAPDAHTLGAELALELAWELKLLPPDTWIYAISAGQCGYGESVTPPVADAIRSVTRTISHDIRHWLAARGVVHA